MLSQTEAPGRLPREAQKALTRTRLLEAAARTFARRGYHGATVDEIASDAGYTTGALYAHFGGKQELFREILHEHVATRMTEYAGMLAREGTLEERTRAAADAWMHFAENEPYFFPLLMEYRAAAARDPELRPLVVDGIKALRRGIALLLREAARESGLDLDDRQVAELAAVVNALGVGLAIERATTPGDIPAHVFGDALVLMMQGLDKGRKSR